MKVKKKWICIIVGIIFIFYLILIIFFNIFPVYLNSVGMKSDYVESVSDDKVWKIYLIPDSLGFVRGYIIPKENHTQKEITVLTKEYGSFDKATTKMYAIKCPFPHRISYIPDKSVFSKSCVHGSCSRKYTTNKNVPKTIVIMEDI